MVRLMVALMGICLATTASAEAIRFVVPSTFMGEKRTQYPLWTSAQWADSCARAVMRGTPADQKRFCEDGFSGLKPKVGVVSTGTRVELLDSRECGDMVGVRVVSGPLKGRTGCLVGIALSSNKP
jgi:hypothetical protein